MASKLRAVGYWRASDGLDYLMYPDPRDLVDPDWCLDYRARIVRYLRSGNPLVQWRGMSNCRFGCGSNGSRCLTDNEWVWPEGLAHYVEVHLVRLPAEFVESMTRRRWAVPELEAVAETHPEERCDFSFWESWSRGSGDA